MFVLDGGRMHVGEAQRIQMGGEETIWVSPTGISPVSCTSVRAWTLFPLQETISSFSPLSSINL
jgi:hypothetical protein